VGIGVDRSNGEAEVRLASAAFVGLALASCATPKQPLDHSLEIALTFDDLPVHGPFPPGQTPQSVGDSIIAALSSARVPATGFVNAHWTVDQPGTISVLKAWRAAGLKLGNHGWAHKHLNEMNVEQFEQEVARDEPVLEQLAGGTDWRWFRYPFLDEGKDAAQRAAARQVLARRGYKVADVTMDFGDWQWTAPYARCSAASDQAAIRHLETMYMAAAREAIGYYRGLSHQLYGRDIPYVILLHESSFEARMVPRLIELYRSAGFRFVGLADAERDPYYADRVHPNLPPQPNGLEDRALARGVKLPSRTNYAAKLAAICPGAGAATPMP
jgi:peptidoglycan-N-acetylglucosamine deacetylase